MRYRTKREKDLLRMQRAMHSRNVESLHTRISTLEEAIVRHEKWDRHLNSDELPFYQPLPHHTELWAEVLAKESGG